MSESAATAAAPAPGPKTDTERMAALVSLCKRRGFVFQASEIYGGMNGVHDYGPLGAQLKKNFKDRWWRDMVEMPPVGPDGQPLAMVGLDTAILQLRQVWDVVGHTANFNDQLVDCRVSKARYRADHLLCVPLAIERDGKTQPLGFLSALDGDEAADQLARKAKKLLGKLGGGRLVPLVVAGGRSFLELSAEERAMVYGPDADEPGTLTEPRAFNLMFDTYVGALRSEEAKTFLRPETCQGIFTNFKNVLDSTRVRPPFGIAQIGKAFRNEVTPRNFTFRTREFEQMELEFFCPPEDSRRWFEFWVDARVRWWADLGVAAPDLFQHVIPEAERAFYSQGTVDLEYRFPFTAPGYGELEGIAHRGDYDLGKHQEGSRTRLEYFDAEANRRYLPHVIEPSLGVERGVLALLCAGYRYDASRASPEWLCLPPSLAPVTLGIFPLVNKDGMPEMADRLFQTLRRHWRCQLDPKQSIGKRYARMDEMGTPFCLTVDGQSLTDQTVTVRHRDTAMQERVAADQLPAYLRQALGEVA